MKSFQKEIWKIQLTNVLCFFNMKSDGIVGNYTEINSTQFYLLLLLKRTKNLMYLPHHSPYNPPVSQKECIWARMLEK